MALVNKGQEQAKAATSAIASDEQAQSNDGAVNPVVVDKRGWTPCGVLNGFEGDALLYPSGMTKNCAR